MNITEIPIVNYHKIEAGTDIGMTTRHPNRFRRDMEIVAGEGYTPITFGDLEEGKSLPEKPFIITFDDGYESVFTHALSLMKEFDFKGIVYIPAEYVGRLNDWDVQFGGKTYKHLSEEQICRLCKEGFEIGSHGMSHHLLTYMDTARLQNELTESRRILQNLCGDPVLSMSYPFGRFNRRVIRTAEQAGYQYGVGSIYFRSVSRDYKYYALRRFNIYRYDSDAMFRIKISARFTSLAGFRDWLIQKGGLATAFYQNFNAGRIPLTELNMEEDGIRR